MRGQISIRGMADTIQLDPTLRGAQMPLTQIPIIDIAPLRGGSGKAATVEEISRACREIGFFYAVNHGVPEEMIARVYAEAKRFFALPEAEKNRWRSRNPPAIAAGSAWAARTWTRRSRRKGI